MQVSKIAVSNQFSVNQNQKVNNTPQFGWVIAGTVNELGRKQGFVSDKLLTLKNALNNVFANHLTPDKVISRIDDMDGGRVLVDVDISEAGLRGSLGSLERVLKSAVKEFDIRVLRRNLSECSGRSLKDLEDSQLKLAA